MPIQVEHLTHTYMPGSPFSAVALNDVSLTIEDGEFMTLLGPSGCGKTTTLRVVSGLEKPQNGFIYMDGKEIVNAAEAYFAPPSQRNLNLVFQSYALWPHMTVYENVAFGLKIRKTPADQIKKMVESALDRMQIGEYAKRYPTELSGGQQQRVAIARAIVSEPRLLLLDEPLSNLDAKLRVDMRSELKRLHHETGSTIIYVTHDQVEALTMSTRIALFRHGELVQVAPPLDLYDNPCNLYTADFIGNPSINFVKVKGKAAQAGLTVDGVLGTMSFPREDMTTDAPTSGDLDITLGVRPDHLMLCADAIKGKVDVSELMGSSVHLHVTAGGRDVIVIVPTNGAATHFPMGSEVNLIFGGNVAHVFSKETGKNLEW